MISTIHDPPDSCARAFALAFHQPDAPEDDDGAIPDWDDYEEDEQ